MSAVNKTDAVAAKVEDDEIQFRGSTRWNDIEERVNSQFRESERSFAAIEEDVQRKRHNGSANTSDVVLQAVRENARTQLVSCKLMINMCQKIENLENTNKRLENELNTLKKQQTLGMAPGGKLILSRNRPMHNQDSTTPVIPRNPPPTPATDYVQQQQKQKKKPQSTSRVNTAAHTVDTVTSAKHDNSTPKNNGRSKAAVIKKSSAGRTPAVKRLLTDDNADGTPAIRRSPRIRARKN